MSDPIRTLREELSRRVAEQGVESPRVEHLRWQIASFERQARRAASGGLDLLPASMRDAPVQR